MHARQPLGKGWTYNLAASTAISEVFAKPLDGSDNPSPGNSAKLSLNADTSDTDETANKNRLNFNTAGKVATYVHPSGVQVNFTYTGRTDLSQVGNSLGCPLTLTTTSGKITNVSDGSRSVQYGFDASGHLTSLRKRNGSSITLAYDKLNRLGSRVYPATADNVSYAYDLLGRRLSVDNRRSPLPQKKQQQYLFLAQIPGCHKSTLRCALRAAL